MLQDVLQHVEYELQIWLNFPFIGDQLDTQKQFNPALFFSFTALKVTLMVGPHKLNPKRLVS